jgi:hypothetical protein
MKAEDIVNRITTTISEVVLKHCHLRAVYDCKGVFILVEDGLTETTMIGCKTLHDLIYWTAKLKVFEKSKVKPEDRVLFRGVVVDPEDMPDSVLGMTQALVLVQHWSLDLCNSVKEATKVIEKLYELIPELTMDEVTVVIGREMSEKIKEKTHEKIDALKKAEVKEPSPIILPESFLLSMRGNII